MATTAESPAIEKNAAPRATARWRRFSLRGLLLLTTLCCVGLGVWTVYVEPYRVQRSVVATVAKLKGTYEVAAAEGGAWHAWLVTTALGDDMFVQVTGVDLSETAASDATLAEVGRLPYLEELRLDRSKATDRGLASLGRLEKLRVLSLRYCAVTDEGLAAVEGLPGEMEALSLTGTRVTDASAGWFGGRSIGEVFIRWTDVTEEGARRIDSLLERGAVHHHGSGQ